MFLTDLSRMGWMTDPWREMDRLDREMRRLFSGQMMPFTRGYPAINVWTGEDDMIVTSEIAGIDPEKIDIAVEDTVLTISGSRSSEELKENESYHRQERPYGDFKRTVHLPFRVDANAVDARYEKGVLTVRLPRREEDKPRKIEIASE